MTETHRRSLAKAITWRVTGTLDTFLLSWLVTGHAASAGGIALTEVVTKLGLYYLHERAWARVARRETHGRSLAKAVSWRVTGSLDTFLIGYVITGHAMMAGSIAASEVFTKVILYYLHERGWAMLRWGQAQPAPLPDPMPETVAESLPALR